MAKKAQANKGDLNVGLMIIQPTKSGIEEIAKSMIRVPNRTISRGQKGKSEKTQKSQKPIVKTVDKAPSRKVTKTRDRQEGK